MAVVVMLSELCSAIVNQSLLGAKAVRAERAFPQRPQPLCWNGREEIRAPGSRGWTDDFMVRAVT